MHKYKLLGRKGEGTFSEVLKAQSISSGRFMAIKCMKHVFESLDQVNNLREIQALRRLSPHPNIVKLFEVLYDQPTGRLALVFELMECNIYELIKGRNHYLPEDTVKAHMYHLMRAVDHMHRHGIFHRDIKPENLLIADNGLKLADFGSCRGIYSKQPYTEYISTRWYRAPECLLTDGYYGYKMDLWGVGCVLFETLALYPLFPGTNEADQIERIHKIVGTPSAELLDKFRKFGSSHVDFNFAPYKRHALGLAKMLPHVSADVIDLLHRLLAYDPDERITARDALRHPWFAEPRAAERKAREAAKAAKAEAGEGGSPSPPPGAGEEGVDPLAGGANALGPTANELVGSGLGSGGGPSGKGKGGHSPPDKVAVEKKGPRAGEKGGKVAGLAPAAMGVGVQGLGGGGSGAAPAAAPTGPSGGRAPAAAAPAKAKEGGRDGKEAQLAYAVQGKALGGAGAAGAGLYGLPAGGPPAKVQAQKASGAVAPAPAPAGDVPRAAPKPAAVGSFGVQGGPSLYGAPAAAALGALSPYYSSVSPQARAGGQAGGAGAARAAYGGGAGALVAAAKSELYGAVGGGQALYGGPSLQLYGAVGGAGARDAPSYASPNRGPVPTAGPYGSGPAPLYSPLPVPVKSGGAARKEGEGSISASLSGPSGTKYGPPGPSSLGGGPSLILEGGGRLGAAIVKQQAAVAAAQARGREEGAQAGVAGRAAAPTAAPLTIAGKAGRAPGAAAGGAYSLPSAGPSPWVAGNGGWPPSGVASSNLLSPGPARGLPGGLAGPPAAYTSAAAGAPAPGSPTSLLSPFGGLALRNGPPGMPPGRSPVPGLTHAAQGGRAGGGAAPGGYAGGQGAPYIGAGLQAPTSLYGGQPALGAGGGGGSALFGSPMGGAPSPGLRWGNGRDRARRLNPLASPSMLSPYPAEGGGRGGADAGRGGGQGKYQSPYAQAKAMADHRPPFEIPSHPLIQL